MRLSPRRPAGFWAYGATEREHPVPHREELGGWGTGIRPNRHLSRPPYAWRPCSLERSASSTPRADSGLTAPTAPTRETFGLARNDSRTTHPPPTPTTRHDLASRRETRGSVPWGEGAGISLH